MSFSTYSCEHRNEVIDEREGTIICSDCGLIISNYFFSQPYNTVTHSVCHEIDEIKEFLERLNLPQCFAEDIYNNFKLGSREKMNRKCAIPYFVYKTLDEMGFPVSIKDISAISGLSENDIYSMQESEKTFCLNASTLLEKYCKLLGINDFKTYSLIKEQLPKNDTGHNPLTVIASTIYKHCKENGLKFSMKEIAKTVGISAVSIQRFLKKC